ncbi:hypothetical protein QM565_04155 [Geitlerinema splendidum]|nr:hypothetical protein [Geitlerinema splendidum]
MAIASMRYTVAKPPNADEKLDPILLEKAHSILQRHLKQNALPACSLEAVVVQEPDVYAVCGASLYRLNLKDEDVSAAAHLSELRRQVQDRNGSGQRLQLQDQ